jgi:two-component system phosphate regulon sensor histidine kinase PhoR
VDDISNAMGGTGEGLPVVKHFMIAHGGKMEIQSQPDKGTKVSLYFSLSEK